MSESKKNFRARVTDLTGTPYRKLPLVEKGETIHVVGHKVVARRKDIEVVERPDGSFYRRYAH